MSEKCVYGVVMDTCSAKPTKENKRYLYRALNSAPIEIVEKGSLKIGEHFQLENRIYEVINKKDSYQTYLVKCVLYRFAKSITVCEPGNEEIVYGPWVHNYESTEEWWSDYSLVNKVKLVITVRY